ncbi:hypothetical protein ACVMH6_007288 [Rhizobium leguminosarum]
MRLTRLTDAERRVRQTTLAFADGRFEDLEVIEWAMALTPEQETERASVRDLFDRQRIVLREPFALAWRCIFEFWQEPDAQTAPDRFLVKRELRQGPQRETIKLIVDTVRPWLKVETAKRFQTLSAETMPRKPKHLKHLLYASISSSAQLTPPDIGLSEINDRDFLFELATRLNASLLAGLNLARMIGSISKEMDITNWLVRRVYFVPPAQFAEGGGEPDRYSDGFAPVTKLMYAVTERLASIDIDAAHRIVASWDIGGWTLYRRLWAAAARNPEFASPIEVAAFLDQLDDREFWIAGSYPEFAELRAVRWNSLSQPDAARLERRLLKGEPAKLVPSAVEKEEVQRYKDRHIVNEIRRIQAGGGNLSAKASNWLEHAVAAGLDAGLPDINLTHGFNQGVRLVTRDRTVVQSFEGVATSRLLEELGKSLTEDGWDDKSENAAEFIAENASTILQLLGKTPEPHLAAKIWQAFGYRFRPSDINAHLDKATKKDLNNIPIALDACRVLINERPEVIRKAIIGLTAFIGNWDRLLGEQEDFRQAWLSLWPYAVARTNQTRDDSAPLSNRAFNTPVGQMLWALIEMCPRIGTGENLMSEGLWPSILSAVEDAEGEALLEAQYVLIRDLGYFVAASPNWATKNLVVPLKSSSSPDLWEAFSSGRLPQYNLMADLAKSIVEATTLKELPGKVKADLAERVIWSTLLDRKENKEPAVPLNLAQQMLRMGGDDVRSQVIRSLAEFLKRTDEDLDDRSRFELAKAVFLDVWPRELTLSSKDVSEELAEFPAAAGAYYAEAADLILPYLTPFDCWSLWDYGVFDLDDSNKKPKIIDNTAKAEAFLSILDKTVGGEEGAVVPDGLEDGLKHIAVIAPKLEKDTRFQRLVTLNRR